MKLGDIERVAVLRLADLIKKRFGASQVILYGSAARGDMDAGSDVDLMIVLPVVDWSIEKQIGELAFTAGLEINRLISTMCFSERELRDRPIRSSPFVAHVRREGHPL